MDKFKLIILGAIILFAVNAVFKLAFAEERMHLDELVWRQKGIEFLDSVFARNWDNTRLSTRPAVTIEWLAGISDLVCRKAYFGSCADPIIFNRLFFTALWIFFSFIFYLLLLKIFDFKISFVSSLFIALYPALNDFNGIVWTDIMLMWTQAFSILCFMVYNRSGEKKFLYLSGVFFGFSLLTKIMAWVIPLLIAAIIFVNKNAGKKLFRDVILLAITGVAVFYLLYPASWHNPYLIFDRASEIEMIENFSRPFSVFYYIYSLFYYDSALAVSSIILTYFVIKEKKYARNETVSFIYILFFYLIILTAISYFKDSQVESVASGRYYVPVMPFLIIFFVYNFYSIAMQKKYRIVFSLPIIVAISYLYNIILSLYFII